MRRNAEKQDVGNADENMVDVAEALAHTQGEELPLGIVQDLLNGSEFVSAGLAAEKPKISELQTVNRLITIELRKLQIATPQTDVNGTEEQGNTNSNPESMASVVEDVLRGRQLVDSGLRALSVNVSHLSAHQTRFRWSTDTS